MDGVFSSSELGISNIDRPSEAQSIYQFLCELLIIPIADE